MKRFYNATKEKLNLTTTRAHVSASCFVNSHSSQILFLVGSVMLTAGLTSIAHAQNEPVEFNAFYIEQAICQLYMLIEGSFGALIMAVSGLGAIVASAMGGYKTAMTCMVVACGAWVIRPLVTLYFSSDGTDIFSAGECNIRYGDFEQYIKVSTTAPY